MSSPQTTTEPSPQTTTERDHATDTVSREPTTTDQPPEDAGYVSTYEDLLTDRFVHVESISVTDDRVNLTYVAESEVGHEVAAGIETVVISFIQVYKRGWDVEAVDATMMDRHDSDTEMGRWRLEARWVENTLDGEWSRTKLLERTLSTYHGKPLKQNDDHHHDDETDDHHHE